MAQLNEQAKRNINELKNNWAAALDKYYSSDITRWKMDRHKGIIERVKTQFSRPSEAAANEDFLKDLREVLIAWKIVSKRRRTRLVDLDQFRLQIKEAAMCIDGLSGLRIEKVSDAKVDELCNTLWHVIDSLKITVHNNGSPVQAKIVSGTKTIHHLVPDLIPPMDQMYTGKFFEKNNEISSRERQKAIFRLLFPKLVDLSQCLTQDAEFMERVGKGFNTSIPKTLDNAIIGHMKLKKETG